MKKDFRTLADSMFKEPENEGPNKVMPLDQAVRNNVKPGMSLFVAYEASAAIAELVRQFHSKDPQFTLITTLLFDYMPVLLHCRLLKKAIFATSGYYYPSAGPNKIVQRAYKERTVEFQEWSHNTIAQQLMAGARCFSVPVISRREIMALTEECAKVTGIPYLMNAYREEAMAVLES